MNANRLKLNDSKIEFIIFGSAPNLKKVKTTTILIGQEHITASSSARNIGAYMDKHLEICVHISNICKAAWHNLYKIGKMRPYLTQNQIKAVVHAHVTSKLDMNNSLLVDTSASQLQKLQRIQNATARLIWGSKRHEHITPVLKSLHWMPIHMKVIY